MAIRRRQPDIVDHLLGELEAPIMRAMWEHDTASVRDVLGILNAGGRPVAYTTVMTVMARLVEKGLLTRERAGKMHRYRATTTRDDFVRTIATRRVQELVAEFGDLAVARFLAEVNGLSPERRQQLERMVTDEEP